MRWPWKKPATDVTAAKNAVQEAVADRPKVREVAQRARELKQRNGFAEAIQRAMGGR
jgi:hypothetical protein